MGEREMVRWVRIPRHSTRFVLQVPEGVRVPCDAPKWTYERRGEDGSWVVDFTGQLAPCVTCGADAYLDFGPSWGVVRYRCGHQPAMDSEDDDGDDQDPR